MFTAHSEKLIFAAASGPSIVEQRALDVIKSKATASILHVRFISLPLKAI